MRTFNLHSSGTQYGLFVYTEEMFAKISVNQPQLNGIYSLFAYSYHTSLKICVHQAKDNLRLDLKHYDFCETVLRHWYGIKILNVGFGVINTRPHKTPNVLL